MKQTPEKTNILPVKVIRQGDLVLFRNRRWAALLIPLIGVIPLAGWFAAGADFGDFSVVFFVLGLLLITGGALMALWAREWVLDFATRSYGLRRGPAFRRETLSGNFQDMVVAVSNRKSHHYSPASQTHRYRGTGLIWTIEFVTEAGERFLYWESGSEDDTRREAATWAGDTNSQLRDEAPWAIADGRITSRQSTGSS